MKSKLVSPEKLVVLDCIERPAAKVADDRDTESIKQIGIREPLIGIEWEGDDYLVDGERRRRIAVHLGIRSVPVVAYEKPDGKTIEEAVRHLRFLLAHHEQDLIPSQKCAIILQMKEFGMKHKQIAKALGISPDSVTNWLSIRSYIPEIVREIDSGRLTSQKARVFDGMTPEGQKTLWKAHKQEIIDLPGGQAHKVLRAQYSPDKHPEYYRKAEMIAARMQRAPQRRKARKRVNITPDEKRRLNTSVEIKEIELREGTEELEQWKREINASIVPIRAVLRSEKLRSLVPAETLEELQAFAEIYC